MKDPRRFIDGDAHAELSAEGRLLRSALVDSAPARVRHATLVALGVTAASAGMSAPVGAGTVGKAETAASVGAGLGGGASVVGGKGLGAVLLAKWTAMGVLSGLLTIGSIQAVKHIAETGASSRGMSSPSASGSSSGRSNSARAIPGVTDLPDLSVPGPSLEESADNPVRATLSSPTELSAFPREQRAVASASIFAGSADSAALPSPSATADMVGQTGAAPPDTEGVPLPPTLITELRMLDRARGMVAAGDGRGALVVLDAYRRQHPHPSLAPEEEVLRIEALAASGSQSEALHRARRFLLVQPKSPQAPRIRALVERMSISQ